MKQCVVMETNGREAVVLVQGGAFRTVPANAAWHTGDVVAMPATRTRGTAVKRALLLAACFVLMLVAGFGTYHYFVLDTTAVISLDINPSMELELNRQDKVVGTVAYNADGEAVLAGVDLKGKPYEAALAELLDSDAIRPYLEENSAVVLSVYSQNAPGAMLDAVAGFGKTLESRFGHLQVYCAEIDREMMQDAHQMGGTSGKLLLAQTLSSIDSGATLEELMDLTTGELCRQIEAQAGDQLPSGSGWMQPSIPAGGGNGNAAANNGGTTNADDNAGGNNGGTNNANSNAGSNNGGTNNAGSNAGGNNGGTNNANSNANSNNGGTNNANSNAGSNNGGSNNANSNAGSNNGNANRGSGSSSEAPDEG